jgi:hypothetical protein
MESLAGGDRIGDLSKAVRIKRVGARHDHAVWITTRKTIYCNT